MTSGCVRKAAQAFRAAIPQAQSISVAKPLQTADIRSWAEGPWKIPVWHGGVPITLFQCFPPNHTEFPELKKAYESDTPGGEEKGSDEHEAMSEKLNCGFSLERVVQFLRQSKYVLHDKTHVALRADHR